MTYSNEFGIKPDGASVDRIRRQARIKLRKKIAEKKQKEQEVAKLPTSPEPHTDTSLKKDKQEE